ncbi:MAG: hypothetical protein R3E96_03405 [Planctomycetota bacterium]
MTNDPRLFDPVADNHTFNGRNHRQYLLTEDYDGDGRDDTPPDVHYDAGLACIDCHSSSDVHGGDPAHPENADIYSRMEQSVAIECESCHGTADTRQHGGGYGLPGQPRGVCGGPLSWAGAGPRRARRGRQLLPDQPARRAAPLRGADARYCGGERGDAPDDRGPGVQREGHCMGRAEGQTSTHGPLQSGQRAGASARWTT